jgi:hypothetical protein
MDEIETTKGTPRRRPMKLWALFGLGGLVMGAAYATGFAGNVSAAHGTDSLATPVFGTGPTALASPSPYVSDVVPGDALTVGFVGQRGVIQSDAVLFEIDLSHELPGQTYYTDIYLSNYNTVTATWEGMQLKWLPLGSCTNPTVGTGGGKVPAGTFVTANTGVTPPFAGVGSTGPRIMNVTSSDAHVSWTGLDGGATYCYGIIATAHDTGNTDQTIADDLNGNWLTEVAPGTIPVMPTFSAIVNRTN